MAYLESPANSGWGVYARPVIGQTKPLHPFYCDKYDFKYKKYRKELIVDYGGPKGLDPLVETTRVNTLRCELCVKKL